MSAPRIGLVGARRVRQGLGPFVAREMAAAGLDVRAVLATTAESGAEAREELREVGVDAAAFVDAGAFFASGLDAVAVLSPAGTHAEYLELALEHGLATFCEKPLVWDEAGGADRACALVEQFAERGLLLVENCQWPRTLDAFRALHPETDLGAARTFAMQLAPASRGLQRIGDALPHPLSLLQRIAPGPTAEVRDIEFERPTAEGTLHATFRYVAGAREVACRVELTDGSRPPRRAGYAVDGASATRLLRLADYAQFFTDGLVVVDVPDPLRAQVGAFAAALLGAAPAPEEPAELACRARMLGALAGAFRSDPGA